ncbi:MAG: LOG family protein, partial [Chloroflexi bacterium]|nr:LOG family protein [Chloroflexota bacterium]
MTEQRIVGVYGSARLPSSDPRWIAAFSLGAALAEAGFTVATGGYEGIMGAASRGARSKGGEVLGYTVTAWDGLPANEAVTERIDSADLFDRLRLFSRADLLIGLDGGIGTLAEIAVAWNLLQVSDARPLLLVGDAWVELVDLVRRRLVVGPDDLSIIRVLPSGTAPGAIVAEARQLMTARRT